VRAGPLRAILSGGTNTDTGPLASAVLAKTLWLVSIVIRI